MASALTLTRSDRLRVLISVFRDELAALRGVEPSTIDTRDWVADTRVADSPIEADSVDRITLATRVSTLFNLYSVGHEEQLLRQRTLDDWADAVGAALDAGIAHFAFRTSGSTGEPKTCEHRLDALAQEAAFLAEHFPESQRVLVLVPVHHIYGFLFGVALPRQLGVPVLDEDEAWAESRRGARAGDLIVATPLQWRQLADAVPQWAADVQGVTSTAPCDAQVLHRLLAHGMARTTEVYGSSETAGIGFRDDPDAPYRLMPWWTPSERHWRRALPDGDAERVTPPPDRLEWVDESRFRPNGRQDGVVQVGGVNVNPERIAQRLAEHPDVAEAAVRPWQRPDGELRMKAYVVPCSADQAPADLDERLQPWLREHFSAPERPVHLRVGTALPRNALGKIQDWVV